MKKILALALVVLMLVSIVACGGKPVETDATTAGTDATTAGTDATTAGTDTPVTPDVPDGTKYCAVSDYNKTSNDGVWQYFFFDPTDSSYNKMLGYEERMNGSLCEWYPWESSWVGVGLNADAAGMLELNNDSNNMIGVLGFCAPADGTYVFTGTLANLWGQDFGTYSIKLNGEAVYSVEINSNTSTTYHFDSVAIEMKAGEIAYISCTSTGGWVSAYLDMDVVKGGESSAYVCPTTGAIDEWSTTNSDGKWVYAYTADGANYTVIENYKEESWAKGWFTPNGTGLDFQTAPEYGHMIECNIKGLNEEITALGYKSGVTGVVTLTVYTKCYTEWGQAGYVVVSVNGEDVATLPMMDTVTSTVVEVAAKEGDVIYLHGVATTGEWLCTFLSVSATEEAKEIVTMPEGVGAAAEFNKENNNGTWVYAHTTDGVTYDLNPNFSTPDWTGDGQPNAAQWYSGTDANIGVGINNDMAAFIEANVNDKGGEMGALGYRAAAAGTVKLTVYVQIRTDWGQSGHVEVVYNGEVIATIENDGDLTATEVTVDMAADSVVYFHGVSNGGWLSTYMNVVVG